MDRPPAGSTDRGRIRVSRLVLFAGLFLGASVAMGALVATIGGPGSAGPPTDGAADETDRLRVVAATGEGVERNGTRVGVVTLTVARPGDGPPIDLSKATLAWVGPDGSARLRSAGGGGGADGRFGLRAVRDAGGSHPVLDDGRDRTVVVVDLGPTDQAGADGTVADSLAPGDAAIVRFTAGGDVVGSARLEVPSSLAGGGAVNLLGEDAG